ncbi:glutaredoxin domain-containing protein [Roseibium aggregatum]|uniref:Glutaredoxin 1 n=1 Tax=Roseibium aggregatum TaxID=187304 RepID=A0A0M6Y7I8_9HYPH|nr:glutaredoxin domain-containing protein [Roseibium aggregatum]CTQ45674.1 Adenosylcobalamin-dependent ribonucleoside-triphosphate reductase [Roseibium aggregatum]
MKHWNPDETYGGFELVERSYFPGMGQAVADRTVNRVIDGRRETWPEVAKRVALGNALLDPRNGSEPQTLNLEYARMRHHLAQASLLMSGRHLQHGDETQPDRNIEVFTNCSTAALSFLLFYLLLNGSGVGRAYDDALMAVDWTLAPTIECVIDWGHKDVASGEISGYMTRRDAEHLYEGREVTVFEVPDSREGWAKAIEVIERMTYEGRMNEVVLLDFSKVRERGAPIMGMQGRPASGPGPLMQAIRNIARLNGSGMEAWRAAMFADHYLAECVLVGGARRAARMATKFWKDATIFGFIELKRGGFLFSSNNSVTIDEEFRERVSKVVSLIPDVWDILEDEEAVDDTLTALTIAGKVDHFDKHAFRVLIALARASYFDGTGEPGIINQDRLTENRDGIEDYVDGFYAESEKFKPDEETRALLRDLAVEVTLLKYTMITNPCGEITLLLLGGYCVIADVVPFHARDDSDAEDAFRTAVRALIRTNLMDALYGREIRRTNRIGVGITGLHEYAYSRFGFGWKELVDEKASRAFWLMLSRFKRAVQEEAEIFSRILGVEVPHTDTTFKPAGTTSKLFGLTEGAHLPAMREFLRWVQFRFDDPLVEEYRSRGYPVRELKSYSGTTIVGFPTRPTICDLDGGDWIVTAAEATPEEQYEYLRLIEKYWITGVDLDGVTPLRETGNQVSYTLKYDPQEVGFADFVKTLIDGQFSVRCCSVMPQVDTTAYEYQPEEPISRETYDQLVANIEISAQEDIGFEHVDCGSGGCPVDFDEEEQITGERESGSVGFDFTFCEGFRIYGRADCPWCEKAKDLLFELGERFQYIECDQSRLRIVRNFYPDHKTVPVVVWVNEKYGEEFVGGYDQLEAVLTKGMKGA